MRHGTPGGWWFPIRSASVAHRVEAGGRCVAYLFFPPVFGAEYGLHAYDGVRIGFYTGILGCGYMVDKQVVIAALKVEMRGEAFLPVEQFFAVGEVAPDAI